MCLDWLQVLTLIMGEDFGNNHAAITLIFRIWITGIQRISANS